jgi:glycosyltransferase involved in cell wall biosynthesis
MANILILGVKVPFTSGGQDVLVRTLREQLVARGHRADTVELPLSFKDKASLLAQATLWRALDLSEFGGQKVDLVIATKFPSYFARHARKSLWLVHQHRPIYELYASRYSDISDDPRDESLRQKLVDADRKVISECSFRSGISSNVVNRLERYLGLDSQVLYPPLPLGNRYRQATSKNYILSVGRLCAIKRVDMMIKALPMVHQFVKLKIVGAEDEPGVLDYFKNEIAKHHLTDRVEFCGRVSDDELLHLYSEALAVYYAPHDEDYGYVTLEAMASGKPVVTAKDSGGVLEFIVHERNGLVAEPDIHSISAAMNRLVENPDFATELGQAGSAMIDELKVKERGWDFIVDSLLEPLSSSAATANNWEGSQSASSA